MFLLFTPPTFGDSESLVDPKWSVGAEVQAYPAGVISGARVQYSFDSIQSLNIRAGYNLARRQDFGKHDDERGGGWGGGLGYRRYGFASRAPFFFGVRLDFWQLGIDWKNNTGISGNTQISVFQPTGEIGYEFFFADRLRLQMAAALGAEINAVTKGDAVGEGAILLLGLSAMYAL